MRLATAMTRVRAEGHPSGIASETCSGPADARPKNAQTAIQTSMTQGRELILLLLGTGLGLGVL